MSAECPRSRTTEGLRAGVRLSRREHQKTCGRAEGGVGRPTPNSGGPAPNGDASAALITLFMAAVAGETIKGYHVAHEARRIPRETRFDFELVVTFDPAGQIDEFTRSVVVLAG
jgi:hypothetical protein